MYNGRIAVIARDRNVIAVIGKSCANQGAMRSMLLWLILEQNSSLCVGGPGALQVVALHQAGQGVQEDFRAFERVDVQFRFVVAHLLVGVQDHGRNAAPLRFLAEHAPLTGWNGVAHNHRTHVAATENLQG